MLLNPEKLESINKSIDFPVDQVDLYTDDKIKAPAKAIIRTDTDEVLSVMSKNYKLVSHKEVFNDAVDYLDNSGFDYQIQKDEIIKKGSRMIVEFSIPELIHKYEDSDTLDFRLYFKNSYDGSWSFDFSCGFYRLICSNGLIIGDVLQKFAKKHTRYLNTKSSINGLKNYLLSARENGTQKFLEMKKHKISTDEGEKIIWKSVEDKIWPKKHADKAIYCYRNKVDAFSNDNLFDVYNGYTRVLRDCEAEGMKFSRRELLSSNVFKYLYSNKYLIAA